MKRLLARLFGETTRPARGSAGAARRPRVRPLLERLEDRLAPATVIWDGGGADNFWTTPANWVGDVAPVAGDRLEFPANAARKTNENNFAAGTAFEKLTFNGDDYSMTGNRITLGALGMIDSSTGAGVNTVGMPITLSGASQVVTVDAPNGVLQLLGNIDGTASILKLNPGTLRLSGANSYAGETTVNNGVLAIGSAAALGATAAGTTVQTGASLVIDPGIVGVLEPLILSGPGFANLGALRTSGDPSSLDGPITSNGGSFNVGNDLTINGVISGQSLTKTGAGQLTLTTANTYTGATLVSGGTLALRHAQALGTTDAGTTVFETGRLLLDGSLNIDGEELTLTIGGSGGIRSQGGDSTWTGPIDLLGNNTVRFDVDSGQLTVGVLRGNAGLSKIGAGRLVVTEAGTYLGGNAINSGVVQIQTNNGLGANGGTTTIASGAALELAPAPGQFITVRESITVSGSGIDGTGAIRVLNDTANIADPLALQSSTSFGADGTAKLTVSGVITGPAGAALNKVGTGTYRPSGNNSYLGVTTIFAGTLEIGNVIVGGSSNISFSLGSTTAGTTVLPGGTLTLPALAVAATLDEPLTIAGDGVGGQGALVNAGGNNQITGSLSLSDNVKIASLSSNAFTNQLTITPGIAGGGFGITKIGPQPVIFAGTEANVYTGATTVLEGSLLLNKPAGTNAVAGPLVIGNGVPSTALVQLLAANQIADSSTVTTIGGTLDMNNQSDTIGSLAMTAGLVTTGTGTLTLNGNVATSASNDSATINGKLSLGLATRTFTIADGSAANDLIINAIVSGNSGIGWVKDGTGRMLLAGVNTYTGVSTINSGSVEINNSSSLGASAAGQGTAVASGAVLRLTGGITVNEPLTLSGAGVNGSGALNIISGTNVWGGAISLGSDATIRPESGARLNVTGAVSGAFGLTKSGVGVVQLAGVTPNSYSGTTTVVEGNLELNKPAGTTAIPAGLVIGNNSGSAAVVLAQNNQIADVSPVTINSSSTLNLSNRLETIGPLTLDRGTVTTGTGTLTLGGNVTVQSSVNPSATPAVIQGNLNLGAANRTFTVADTSTDPLVPEISISAIVSGPSGAGFTKQGAGSLELSGANTYSGPTTIAAGQINARNASALGTTAGNTTVQAGAKLFVGGVGGTSLTVAEPLVLGGTLESGPGTNTWSGGITAPGGTYLVGASNTLIVSGVVSGGAGALFKNGAGTVQYTGASANTFSGATVVREGTMLLSKTAGVNALLGTVTIGEFSAAATLRLSTSNQIADTAGVIVKSGNTTPGLFDLNNQSDLVNGLSLTGGSVTTGTGTLGLSGGSGVSSIASSLTASITGRLDLGANTRTFNIADGAASPDLTVSAQVIGAGGLTKTGAGQLRLDGATANTYTGATTVNEGTLFLAKNSGVTAIQGALVVGNGAGSDQVVLNTSNQIADTAAVTINSSGALDLNNQFDTIGPLTMTSGLVTTGTGTLTLAGNVTTNANAVPATINGRLNLGTASRTFTIADGQAALDLVVNALVSGNVGFTKAGPGVMQLTASNTYTGATTVNAGTLLVDGTQTASPITVNTSAVLGGRGTTGAVTLAGGTIAPGNVGTAGSLITGNVTLNSSSTLQVQLNGPTPVANYDVLSTSGSVNLGNATLSLSLNFTPAVGTQFLLVSNDGVDEITGRFAGLANDGDIITINGLRFSINYHGGDGNDVVLTCLGV